MIKPLGIAATGHVETSLAATEILKAGGNAFDAAIGALCAACVAEPMLASLGGGGFMLSRTGDGQSCAHDFFCQTPAQKKPVEELDFFPIVANFGPDTQEFHAGMGAIAVPGTVAGMYQIHRDLGRMPMAEIMQPAIELGHRGVRVDAVSEYLLGVLEPILRSDETLFRMYESRLNPGQLIGEGETLRSGIMATSLEQLRDVGESLFYQGEWAQQMARDCDERGGSLTLQDLAAYRVERRKPLQFTYRGAECQINPPPSPGGCLIAFALGLMKEGFSCGKSWGEPEHVRALVRAQHGASRARVESQLQLDELEHLLDAESLSRWRDEVQWHSLFSRGTTHISVADAQGNIASLTTSNGEGNTYVLPSSGIILNNMLGEDDLNPGGFHCWREGSRLASMMSPMIAQLKDGSTLALGTGGSNRIRSAMMQVLVNILDFDLSLEDAVKAPRLHLEGGDLSVEAGFSPSAITELRRKMPGFKEWPSPNLFFGGVHFVRLTATGEFEGVGDHRRNGAVRIA